MSVRWGFLGAGLVATTALAPAVHNAHNAKLEAVASRDLNRSKLLEPTTTYNSYEELLADPKIDAVYISLANHQHLEWSVKALTAGKHVLCEKPLAINSDQAKLLAECAVANNRLLVEALWTRWHPRFQRIIELVKSGKIGDLHAIDSAFTFQASLTGNYRLNPEMGGGSLLDVGPYQINTWLALASENREFEISKIKQNIGATGVDLSTQFTGVLADTILVSALTSFESNDSQRLLVTGSTGEIECLGNDAFTSWKAAGELRVGTHVEEFAPVDAYQLMVEAMSARITGESSWLPELNESIRTMEILDQLGASSI